jgi:hypothetical protein
MIRKWEWIRGYCKGRGYEESAEVADQIDRVLYYLYEGANTEALERYISGSIDGITETGEVDIDAEEVLETIVKSARFCIGCDGKNTCNDCLFGGLVGVCNEGGSLYREFVNWCWRESWCPYA